MSSDEYLGCSDGGCIFGHRGGMHTNGGCHCVPSLSTFHTMTANERLELRNKIKKLAAQNKVLREEMCRLEQIMRDQRHAAIDEYIR